MRLILDTKYTGKLQRCSKNYKMRWSSRTKMKYLTSTRKHENYFNASVQLWRRRPALKTLTLTIFFVILQIAVQSLHLKCAYLICYKAASKSWDWLTIKISLVHCLKCQRTKTWYLQWPNFLLKNAVMIAKLPPRRNWSGIMI